MKIAILTFSKVNNYGANLQCYALCKILQEWGHDVVIIDIQLKKSIKAKLRDIIFTHYFKSFRKKYLPFFTPKYGSVEKLTSNPPVADVYIVGSDQVWNPNITKQLNPKIYFFSFLPKDVCMISYAASFGNNKWDWPEVEEYSKLLQNFKAISVREDSGIGICENIFKVKAKCVLDPTLLLNSYDNICGEYDDSKQTNEILYFNFSYRPDYEKDIVAFAHMKGLKPVHMTHSLINHNNMINVPCSSIKNWLNRIRYARFVITGSFHCTAFSVLYNKDFISLPSGSIERSERKICLLANLGLDDRYFSGKGTLFDYLKCMYDDSINYKTVEKKLEMMKQQSINWLKEAIMKNEEPMNGCKMDDSKQSSVFN